MKRVIGTPWNKEIESLSRDENIDILLKVGDAIGFAHTRGVVHRDIKPENIMLGDFGVVMVMDWGIALAQPDFEKKASIAASAGLGGTPAFMSPEMATGPVESINASSDVYLLGATLYMIITGSAPHSAENVAKCLQAVARNEIKPVKPEHEGGLLDIAMKAMATRQEDRYQDVPAFQAAIRQYRSHSESVAISTQALANLKAAKETGDYQEYSKATFGFHQALLLWSGNADAEAGRDASTLAHAERALQQGDFELGLSILDDDRADHADLIAKLREGLAEREARQTRLRTFKRVVAAMLAVIVVGGSVAGIAIEYQRRSAVFARDLAKRNADAALEAEKEAVAERDTAEKQTAIAEKQTKIAEKATAEANASYKIADNERAKAVEEKAEADRQREEAERQKKIANEERAEAVRLKLVAERATDRARSEQQRAEQQSELARAAERRATYEAYLSRIGLAKARIDSNEFKYARQTLLELRDADPVNAATWEWRWLSSYRQPGRPSQRRGRCG